MSDMLYRLSIGDISSAFRRAIAENLIDAEDTSVVFHDLSRLKARVDNLIDLFPSQTLHAIAVKANPLAEILRYLNKPRVGVEVASLPELSLAENIGFEANKIVFDSPAKTINEIEYALKQGIHINVDSFSELDRVAELKKRIDSRGNIGIRLNPQVGPGRILSTSVADEYSKFGIPLKENREKLIEAYLKNVWLTGIHLHVGSQGYSPGALVKGIETVYKFALEVNESLRAKNAAHRIEIFDIGGGLPVSYRPAEEAVSMHAYRDKIVARCPELFTSKFKLITEFGRYLHANTAWAASRVEYIKETSGIKTAIIHVGADMFVRKCYNPDDWHHEISVLDCEGNIKSSQDGRCNIAGPLCFAGDIIARDVELPAIEEGDYIVIHDAGAYTLSMWSRYNSRQVPKIIGYYDDGAKFEILKEREDIDTVMNFWK